MGPAGFDYAEAFSRNVGWVTEAEQAALRQMRVAIAGMGGVGGSHLLTLTRLGVGGFHLAEFDRFALANFNRQAGATVSTLGRPKLDVMVERARDINPELAIETFPEGVTRENVRAFLDGIDLFVDGVDFFAMEARRALFAECAAQHIPALTAAPLGMGAALLYFEPGGMTFDEYFGMEGESENEQYLRFFLGLAPSGLHAGYLRDPSTIDLAGHRGPSTAAGVELCAGVVASAALKVLLGRGEVPPVPRSMQFDAYANRLARSWRPGGHRHPLELLKRTIARRRLMPARSGVSAPTVEPPPAVRPVERILDLARWAPSADNQQPWRFTIVDDRHVVVRTLWMDDRLSYDITGRALRVALGALLQTIEIAATDVGWGARWEMRAGTDDQPVVDVSFEDGRAGGGPDPLLPFIRERSTQRRPLSRRPLSAHAKRELEAAAGTPLELHWLEGEERKRVARALSLAGEIRLSIPETYPVHRRIIEWGARQSVDRIPDRAIGADALTLRSMRWALASWGRAHFMNRFMGGTLVPRLQLDYLPGTHCAAHFVIGRTDADVQPADELAAGRALQRLWLTATRLGVRLQPEFAPLIFGDYGRRGTPFTSSARGAAHARRLAARLDLLLGPRLAPGAIVLGRVGYGPPPEARSLRLPLEQLLEPLPS